MITYALYFGFACIAIAQLLAMVRLIIGPDVGDRILALDTMSINTVALIVLLGLAGGSQIYFEAALIIAMLGFVSTVAYARFVLRGHHRMTYSLGDIAISLALVIGGAFVLVGSIGLIKLRNPMSRLHAPTKAGTLGVGSILIASVIYSFAYGEGSLHAC